MLKQHTVRVKLDGGCDNVLCAHSLLQKTEDELFSKKTEGPFPYANHYSNNTGTNLAAFQSVCICECVCVGLKLVTSTLTSSFCLCKCV